ncbi:hypothetical protein NQ314_019592 [Rhamnusium bicolor]|uniref:Uncharacterized protein n=1 Tax=Rhamnusium bicolor TaxID=1586634 RepID=A0AAV8WN89_9CUCU|nr:hypothetical protein NQ314_019592 [Rhamnusium bicolor]
MKLILATGINWSMEIVSYVVQLKHSLNVSPYIWYFSDFCNAVYGVFIFFIFVFNRRIWRSLKKR